VSKISYHRLPEDKSDNQAIQTNTLPLLLAGEGWGGEGGLGIISPSPLSSPLVGERRLEGVHF